MADTQARARLIELTVEREGMPYALWAAADYVGRAANAREGGRYLAAQLHLSNARWWVERYELMRAR